MMVVSIAVATALGVAPAGADSCATRGRRCSTPPARPGAPNTLSAPLSAGSPLGPGDRVVVPVVYHLVYESIEPPYGEPDDLEHAPPVALVERQTRVLNRAFRGTAFSFVTVGAELKSFARWRTTAPADGPLTSDVAAMIRELNDERPTSLHVFLMRIAENRAAMPDAKMIIEDFRGTDGILMAWDYLPLVGTLRHVADPMVRREYFQGDTLVHLVGHYFGLLHTFEAWPAGDDSVCKPKCGQITDLVRDTPVHRGIRSVNCYPIDTCKDYPGLDPVTNYMTLEPDYCASEFTPGQVSRMERMVASSRPYLIVRASAGTP